MRSARRLRRSLAIAAALAAFSGALQFTAAASSAAVTPVPGSAVRAGTQQVLLPDGERVLLTPTGSVLSPPGSRPLQIVHSGAGHTFAIPRTPAVRLIDPTAFDVQNLAAVQAANGGRLPLSIGYTGDRPALAGLTWTDAHSGYLTPGSAGSFAAGLRMLSLADGNAVRIAVAAPLTVRPHFVMHTVTFKPVTTGLTTDYGFLSVINVDDVNRWQTQLAVYHAPDRASLPDGHYVALAFFFSRAADDHTLRVLTVPFTVRQDTTVRIHAGTADSPITVSTPRPAKLFSRGVVLAALDDAGRMASVVAEGAGDYLGAILVAPTSAATRVRYQPFFHLESRPGAGDAYSYDLAFSQDNIKRNQHYRVRARSLAAVRARFARAGTASAEYRDLPLLTGPRADDVTGGSGTLFPIALPSVRTQYTSSGIYWSALLYSDEGELAGRPRSYERGSTPTVDWLRQPLHPGTALPARAAGRITDPDVLPDCAFCRKGDQLSLALYPWVDSRGHFGLPYDATYAWTLRADGTSIGSGNSFLGISFMGAETLSVPSTPAQYSLSYDVTRPAELSSSIRTTWTFRSARSSGSDAGTRLRCLQGATPVTDCRVQDVLMAGYRLPVDRTGSERVGPTTATIKISQIPGATARPIRGFHADVSFDDGAMWQHTTLVASGYGRFTVAYTNPAASGTNLYASLRVHAADTSGALIDQTIVHAYRIQ